MIIKTPEDNFYEEDAQRVNAMAKFARDSGIMVDVEEGEPPQLEADGSLKDKSE